MSLFSLEFFVEKVEVPFKQITRDIRLNIQVTCGNIINFALKYFYKDSAYNVMKGRGVGKAVVFSTNIDNLIISFTTDFRVSIVAETDAIDMGIAQIKWMDNFEQQVRMFGNNLKFIQHDAKYNTFNDAKESIGTIQISMCLVYHGENIEIPITLLGSQINIPMNFRKKSHHRHDNIVEAWEPLFVDQTKAANSVVDPGMSLYAEFAGVQIKPSPSSQLTPDYINKHLCGHKTCPGAKKFKEYGLGPLAPPGSGLGTVSSFNTKPLGLYGMSQAYGTLDAYGAYGMFVKKTNKPKSCCGSPDCPYTIFYGKPDPSGEELDERPKKCRCKNCRKNNEDNASSKQSSKGSTCGCPKSPNNAPKEPVTCPFLPKHSNCCCSKKPPKLKGTCPVQPKLPHEATCPIRGGRQSAGADKYNSECPDNTCPYSTARQRRQSSNGKQSSGGCGGNVCPLHANSTNKRASVTENTLNTAFLTDETLGSGSLRTSLGKNNCKDRECLFFKDSEGSIGIISRKSEEIDECPDTCLFYPSARRKSAKKNCADKDCFFYQSNLEEEEEEDGLCGGGVCPLDREKKQKTLSLLVNEDGKKLLFTGTGDTKSVEFQKNILSTLSSTNKSEMYMLISRLVSERQQTNSLNNYFNPDGLPSQYMFEKKKKRGPCSKDSCRAAKYKTCSECGGVSRSGATCDNTNVSFSTISYDESFTTTGRQDTSQKTEASDIKPTETSPAQSSALKKKVPASNTTTKNEKVVVKVVKPRKRRTRFVYNEGEAYPGIRLGHKKCSTPTKNVPANMGWLWNIKGDWERRRRKNYKPGKVGKTVEDRIIQHRRSRGIPDPPELTMLVKKKKAFNINQEESESEEEEVVPKPTLKIEKKEGNYLITMNPLKDPKSLASNEDPYMRCKPMQFLIIKPKKEATSPIPRYGEFYGEDAGEDDYSNLYKDCLCDEDKIGSSSSSSSESELNIEFTTPAGLIIPERMKKMINVVNTENQFKEADFHSSDYPTIVPTIYKKDKKKKKKVI